MLKSTIILSTNQPLTVRKLKSPIDASFLNISKRLSPNVQAANKIEVQPVNVERRQKNIPNQNAEQNKIGNNRCPFIIIGYLDLTF